MSELTGILAKYDAFLVDLWGVIHDGNNLYPGVLETLQHMAQQNKPVVFLSNAPRVAAKAAENLARLGIGPGLYRDVITSGQVAHDWLRDATPYGKKYYYLGPGKDEDIISDLSHYESVAAEDADFILCTGYEYDLQPHDEVIPTLQKLLDLELPMLCVNPDLVVVKIDGTHQLCAGECAGEYERMGGDVTYIGKPHPEVYAVGRQLIGEGKILAVGDNPLTDILGANRVGIDSLLITGGILKMEDGGQPAREDALLMCQITGSNPTHILASFAL